MDPVDEKSGSISDKLILTGDNLEYDFSSISKDESLNQKIPYSLETGNVQLINTQDEKLVLVEPYFPDPRLIVLGGGHIAKPLVEFGTKLGFYVTVVDDRPSFANSNRFPDADKVICESFENSFNLINISRSDFVVIVTRGHRHDGICLRKSLDCNPAYIGMIGSKRRVKGMKNELLNEGYTEEQLNKLNAPIGLDIGAITPEEIALSIIAQVVSFRRTGRSSLDSKADKKKFNWPEFDSIVIDEMAKGIEEPKALVTIISAKGSVPRKAGAKMIVWGDGRTIGSIGGGCSEASVITTARDVILDKGYVIQHVDMTGDVAEEEGMVCGGIMDVLIESF